MILVESAVEYMRILYKINDIYSRYEIDDIDLLDDIEYYNAKKYYPAEEINELQNKCISTWKTVLTTLCDNLKTQIKSNKYYTQLLKSELKQVKKIKIELLNETKTLDEYEDLFDNKLLSLRDGVESKIATEEYRSNQDKRKLCYAFVLGVISSIIGWIVIRCIQILI